MVTTAQNTFDKGEGRMIVITSPDGKFRTRYFHLSKIDVKEGQKISESFEIGEMGGSANGKKYGRTTHLHYEIQKIVDGEWVSVDATEGKGKNSKNIVDPQNWIQKKEENISFKPDLSIKQDETRVNNSFLKGLFNWVKK